MADASIEAESDHSEEETAVSVIRRGLSTTPDLVQGLLATALIGVAVAIGQISIPIIIQLALDRGGLTSGDVDRSTLLQLVLAGLAIVAATEILSLIAKRRMIRRAETSLRKLRVLAFDHVHRQSLAVHNEQATGVMISRVTSDVDALSRFADWGLFVWVVQPVVVVGVFITMAVYSWQLALLALVAFAPVFGAMRWVRRGMARAHNERRTAIGDLLGAFSESLSGAEVVRAYNAQHRTQARLEQVSETRYRTGLRANFYMSGVYVVGDLIGSVMLALVLLVGVVQREALGLTAGELVAVLFLITLLLTPIAELGETINTAQEAVAGWRKVLNLLDEEIEDLNPETGVALPDGALSIDAEHVNFDYGDGVPILRDVSVHVPEGARVAIVGETGSGKSTFARLLCRLADPVGGSISVAGAPLVDVGGDARHAAIRMVPQDGFLFDATIQRNIAFGRADATDADIDRAIELLGLESWIAGMPQGLATPVGERGSLLSVGERQLVSFARAAVADPGLLILDEATSSVDPQTDLQLTRALDRLAVGRTVVSIAHRLSTAESSDLVLVFAEGELVEQGGHDELVAAGGRYAELFRAWSADSAAPRP